MRDLQSHRAIWIKGALFLLLGMASAALLLNEAASLTVAVLLAIAVWSFCRAYYFAFYVIEHYVDPRFRFSGLLAFVNYWLRQRTKR